MWNKQLTVSCSSHMSPINVFNEFNRCNILCVYMLHTKRFYKLQTDTEAETHDFSWNEFFFFLKFLSLLRYYHRHGVILMIFIIYLNRNNVSGATIIIISICLGYSVEIARPSMLIIAIEIFLFNKICLCDLRSFFCFSPIRFQIFLPATSSLVQGDFVTFFMFFFFSIRWKILEHDFFAKQFFFSPKETFWILFFSHFAAEHLNALHPQAHANAKKKKNKLH